jgi:hypothetical protein
MESAANAVRRVVALDKRALNSLNPLLANAKILQIRGHSTYRYQVL